MGSFYFKLHSNFTEKTTKNIVVKKKEKKKKIGENIC